MKRLYWISILFIAILLGACSTAEEPAAEPAAPAAEEPAAEEPVAEEPMAEEPAAVGEQLYVFLPKSLDNPYWDECRLGMEAKAEELGVQAEFLGPPTASATEQVAIFEAVIARNPAGIAVSPNDPATVEAAIAMATEAGIPVFAWDADAPNSVRLAYVGTLNEAAGATAGEELAKAIDYQGQVAILHGSLSAQNAIERVTGFEQALAAYPDIEIVAVEPTEDSPDQALSKAEALLQAYPDLAAFYGVTGVGVPGAAGEFGGGLVVGVTGRGAAWGLVPAGALFAAGGWGGVPGDYAAVGVLAALFWQLVYGAPGWRFPGLAGRLFGAAALLLVSRPAGVDADFFLWRGRAAAVGPPAGASGAAAAAGAGPGDVCQCQYGGLVCGWWLWPAPLYQ